jgi:hypothetical protein
MHRLALRHFGQGFLQHALNRPLFWLNLIAGKVGAIVS